MSQYFVLHSKFICRVGPLEKKTSDAHFDSGKLYCSKIWFSRYADIILRLKINRKMNPNAIQSWKTTPTIIIEYVDCHTAHTLEPLQERANDVATETNENFHNVFSSYDVDLTLPPLKTKPPTITPEVDAYVTPLSLCHTEESNETFVSWTN